MDTGNFLVGVTSDMLLRSLDAAALRHNVLAANVANASNLQYQPLRVSFEEQLRLQQAQLLQRTDPAAARRALTSVRPEVEPDPVYRDSAEHVRLDAEVSKLMQNAVYYEALLAAMNKNGSILRMAIREGRN